MPQLQTSRGAANLLETANFLGKRSYVQVDPEQRENLINIVEVQGATIKKAASILGINYSTAKHIMKQHKATNPHISGLNQLALT